jgi:2-keto-4-pentenoate hydratase/2-oxohepta-3-ene-1,7-dioic acid hydratase in catechol pathway
VRASLEDWDEALPRLTELARRGDGAQHRLEDLAVRAPVRPDQILQSGANYRKHVLDLAAAEGARGEMTAEEVRAEALRVMDQRLQTGEPYLFLGALSAVCGAYDEVVLPQDGEQHDWELELAVVIGRPARHVPVERALDYVAGYTIANDLTTRDRVYRPDMGPLGTDWMRAKNAPTFLPVGPYIVPAAFVDDWRDLRITLELNGDVMQDESTEDMLYGVPELLSYASAKLALRPGDLLLTGSPAGNGAHHGRFLTEGDVMDCTITGLGRQRNRCVAEAVPATR